MDPDFYTEDDVFHDDFEEEMGDEWSGNFFKNSDDLFTPFDELDIEDALYPDQLNADQLGVALAFGEILSEDRGVYDVDEDTDKENWEGVMKLYPLQEAHHSTNARSLSRFEQYINGITSGQTKGPWRRD